MDNTFKLSFVIFISFVITYNIRVNIPKDITDVACFIVVIVSSQLFKFDLNRLYTV